MATLKLIFFYQSVHCKIVHPFGYISTDYFNIGNKELVKNADKFWWFGHIWNHHQAHLSDSKDYLVSLMKQNYEFAVVSRNSHKVQYKEYDSSDWLMTQVHTMCYISCFYGNLHFSQLWAMYHAKML